MRIMVDLNRCQSYGQCVYFAPTVFRFHGELQEAGLEYDYTPSDDCGHRSGGPRPRARSRPSALEDEETSTGALIDRRRKAEHA